MNLITNDKKRSTLSKTIWIALAVIGWVGVILMWVNAYGTPHAWQYRLHLPFFFTHISNVMGAFIATVMVLGIFSDKVRTYLKIFAVVNLIVTLLVYWSLVFKDEIPTTGLAWTTNITVHLLTPLLMIGAFLVSALKDKEIVDLNMNWKKTFLFLAFPLTWVVLATIMYYSMGAHEKITDPITNLVTQEGDAFYGFLDFNGLGDAGKWFMAPIYLFGISGLYYGLAFGAKTLITKQKTK